MYDIICFDILFTSIFSGSAVASRLTIGKILYFGAETSNVAWPFGLVGGPS